MALAPAPSAREEPRIIHYLGSKLRVLPSIVEAVRSVCPPGQAVCDLFAGSGVVSGALSDTWRIVAADVQEYSRVLCSMRLNPHVPPVVERRAFVSTAREGSLRAALEASVQDLIDHEDACLRSAKLGDPHSLAELIEAGSITTATAYRRTNSSSASRLHVASQARLERAGLGSGPDSVVTRQFGGVYFSWKQAVDFDALLSEVNLLQGEARDFYLAAVLASASECVNSVGKQFAQPIRPRDAVGRLKQHLIARTVRDRSADIYTLVDSWLDRLASLPRPRSGHSAHKADFRQVLADASIQFDAVYADPPYTRDHYSRYYHVLETMSLHDEPEIATTMIRTGGSPAPSRGMYRIDRHQSPFSIKSQAPSAFHALCAGVRARGIPLILSYSPFDEQAGNRPRLLRLEELVAIAQSHFQSIERRDLGGSRHNKLNLVSRNVEVGYEAEIILTCRP